MEQLIAWLVFSNYAMVRWILKLRKENDILHSNNIGLGQIMVAEGLMTQEQFERSLKK